jgi:hypothetical protein
MANDDLRSAGIAALIMAVVNAILLIIRFTFGPIFIYTFEFTVFELPFFLLVLYFMYLWRKQRTPVI